MPYPAQFRREDAITIARDLIEADGVDGVSLARLAAALGIKAPSLYKHFADKDALLREINTLTWRGLTTAMGAACDGADSPPACLSAMASAYRAYALAHPTIYALAFDSNAPATTPDPSTLEALALPLQGVVAEMVGEDESLAALRGFWALVHGFVVLEIGGKFQRGGSLEAAYHAAVAAYLSGLRREF
jgi:AcrR family transcriptional regulator